MRHKTLLTLTIALAVVLILGGSILMVRRAQAQETRPQAPLAFQGALSPQAVVSTTFTYQGRLTGSTTGSPVAGPCNFRLTLYGSSGGSDQIGSSQTKTSVTLSNGCFSVELDFGANAFNGDARYMQIEVDCGSGYVTLSPRALLNPAPYALSLRPGAVISGILPGGTILSARNSGSTGAGVSGQVAAQSGLTPITGAAVWGDSASVPGVVGTSNGATGVFGWSVSNAGVSGVSTSGNGVYGASTSGYGVYSEGNAHVEGNLTWKAKTGYVSIPAAALQPNAETVDWDISTNGAYFWSNQSTYYVAPVFLPHGATVTKVTTWWKDNSFSGNALLELRRAQPGSAATQPYVTMASLATDSMGAGIRVDADTTIDYAGIDNSQYSYILHVNLPDSSCEYWQTVIEYTTTGPH